MPLQPVAVEVATAKEIMERDESKQVPRDEVLEASVIE